MDYLKICDFLTIISNIVAKKHYVKLVWIYSID